MSLPFGAKRRASGPVSFVYGVAPSLQPCSGAAGHQASDRGQDCGDPRLDITEPGFRSALTRKWLCRKPGLGEFSFEIVKTEEICRHYLSLFREPQAEQFAKSEYRSGMH